MRLEDLERELRAERPEVDPEFARKLDDWAAAGFPRGGGLGPRSAGAERGVPGALRRAWERVTAVPPRRLIAPVGAAAVLIVVAGVGLSQVDFGDSDEFASRLSKQTPGATGGGSEEAVAPATDGGEQKAIERADAPTAADMPSSDVDTLETQALSGGQVGGGDSFEFHSAPGDGGGVARGTEERLQDKTARLSLGADADEVQDVANDVVAVTDRHDGIVLDSQVTSDRGGARASFELEIPATELDAALTDLSELGDVISRTEAAQDITQPFVRAQRRYAATLESIEKLRSRLIEADTHEERRLTRLRIRTLEAQADAYETQRDQVARQARFASVAVEITSNGPGSDDDGGWSLGDAVDDAGDVLRTLAGIGLVSLAILVPIALVGALAFWIVTATRRHSRERALDS